MKKLIITSIASAIFLILSTISAYFTRYLSFVNAWYPLGIGVCIISIGAIIVLVGMKVEKKCKISNKHLKLKTIFYLVAYFLNAFALGFCIRAWYLYRGYENELWIMILVSLACVVYLWIYYVFLYIPYINQHFTVYFLLFVIISFIGYFLVIFFSETTFVSTFGYYMIIELGFILSMSTNKETVEELLQVIALSSLTVFIVAVIIALLMIAGDSIDVDGYSSTDGLSIESPRKTKINKFTSEE